MINDILEAVALADESKPTNLLNAIGQLDRSQAGAVIECQSADLLQSGRSFKGLQGGALIESAVTNGLQGSGKLDVLKNGAPLESKGINRYQRIAQINRLQLGAAGKSSHADGLKTGRQSNGSQLGAAGKRILADRCHSIGNLYLNHGGEIIENSLADTYDGSSVKLGRNLYVVILSRLAVVTNQNRSVTLHFFKREYTLLGGNGLNIRRIIANGVRIAEVGCARCQATNQHKCRKRDSYELFHELLPPKNLIWHNHHRQSMTWRSYHNIQHIL